MSNASVYLIISIQHVHDVLQWHYLLIYPALNPRHERESICPYAGTRHRSHVFFQGQSCPCGTNTQECLDPVFGESFCYPVVDFWLLGQVEVQIHQMQRRNCICCIKIFRHIIYFIQYTYWKQTHFQEKVCGRSFESIARVYKFVIQYCTSGCSCFSKRLSSLAFSNYNMLASCK